MRHQKKKVQIPTLNWEVRLIPAFNITKKVDKLPDLYAILNSISAISSQSGLLYYYTC